MSFRKRQNEGSDCDSDDEPKLPTHSDDEDVDEGPSAKRVRGNMWTDILMEEQLLSKGQRINLDKTKNKNNQGTIARGPESYEMPPEVLAEMNKVQQRKKKKNAEGGEHEESSSEANEKPVVVVTPPNDDPFGDAAIAPAENFGVKRSGRKAYQPHEGGRGGGWWSNRGHARMHGGRGRGDHQGVKRDSRGQAPTPKVLLTEDYSLETLLAVEFMEETPVDKLAEEMGRAMGEKDPTTVTKIVVEIGEERSIKLFNEMREIEKNGGMKTADGSRRRTPGGVFITLFKMDPEVSRETKNSIFGEMRQVDKVKSKTRKRGREFAQKLADLKETVERAAEEEKEDPEELADDVDPSPSVRKTSYGLMASEPMEQSVFDDDVANMI